LQADPNKWNENDKALHGHYRDVNLWYPFVLIKRGSGCGNLCCIYENLHILSHEDYASILRGNWRADRKKSLRSVVRSTAINASSNSL